MFSVKFISLVLALSSHVWAAPNPTTPAATDAGASQTFTWDLDTTGVWKSTTILLRSGANLNMSTVTTVTTNIDCTTVNSFAWTIPQVSPYSDIYFYELKKKKNKDSLLWTTRFPIQSPTGTTVAPANAKQPDGKAIPWGIGTLVGGSSVTTWISASTNSTSSSTSSVTMTSMSTMSMSNGVPVTTVTSSSGPSVPSSTSLLAPTATSTKSGGEKLKISIVGAILSGAAAMIALV